jgi:hypothetical protein
MSTASIALAILGVVALAVLLAAAYAIFGKPHSPESKERHWQVVSGFGIAGGILLGALLVGFLVIGLGIAFFGIESSRISSKAMAFLIAAASFVLIALFVRRWAKYFAGWMAFSVANALREASTGHALNNPSIRVPLSAALTMAALMVISVCASIRFGKKYKLNAVDKSALLLWVLAFAVGANTEHYMLPAITLGCTGLVSASFYHRYRNPHLRSKRNQAVGTSS